MIDFSPAWTRFPLKNQGFPQVDGPGARSEWDQEGFFGKDVFPLDGRFAGSEHSGSGPSGHRHPPRPQASQGRNPGSQP